MLISDGLGLPAIMGMAAPTLNMFKSAVENTKAGSKNTLICCVSDSTTAGLGSNGANGSYNNARAGSYPVQIASLFNANVAKTISDNVAGANNATSTTNLLAYNPQITMATPGDWGIATPNLAGNRIRTVNTSNPTSRMVWSCPIVADTFEIYLSSETNSGTLAVYFDGNATPVQSINTVNAAYLTTKYTFNVPLGVHSIEFAKTAGQVCYIADILAYDSTTKCINVFNAGGSSMTAAQMADSTDVRCSIPVLKKLAPDLCIINAGLNDFAATTQAVYEAALSAIVDAAQVSGDAILVFPNSRGNANEDAFKSYMNNVAVAKNVPILDIRSVFGTVANANAMGWMSGDSVHPNSTGYGIIANYIYNNILSFL